MSEAEFAAIAHLAGVEPDRLIKACDDPTNLLEHLSLTEIQHLGECADRLSIVQRQIGEALGRFTSYAQGFMAARNVAREVTEESDGDRN